MKKLISVAVMQMVCVMVNAQQIQFAQSYFNSGTNEAFQFVQLPDSGFAIAGWLCPTYPADPNTTVGVMIKLDKYGNLILTKTYTASAECLGIALYDDSTLIVSGGFYKIGVSAISKSRTNLNGDTLWTKFYGSSMQEMPAHIRKTNDSCFVSLNGNSWTHGIHKIDSAGNELWHMSNNMGLDALDIEVDPFGGYIVVGTNGGGVLSYNALYIKPNGQVLWQHSYGNNWNPNIQPSAWDVTVANDGNFLVACDGNDWHLMKLDRLTGDTLWTKKYLNGNYRSVAIENLGNGTYALFTHLYVLIIDDIGDILYQLNEPFYFNLYARQVKKTNDGGFAMCGQINNAPLLYKSIAFVKFDSLGNTQYTGIFNPDNNLEAVYMYPSPADEHINFSLPPDYLNNGAVLIIFDINGQQIMSSTILNQQPISISHLSNGLYIAEIRTARGDKVVRQKLVVQH